MYLERRGTPISKKQLEAFVEETKDWTMEGIISFSYAVGCKSVRKRYCNMMEEKYGIIIPK